MGTRWYAVVVSIATFVILVATLLGPAPRPMVWLFVLVGIAGSERAWRAWRASRAGRGALTS